MDGYFEYVEGGKRNPSTKNEVSCAGAISFEFVRIADNTDLAFVAERWKVAS